jgi:serine phosphatase RsbU (regulator of sigma subunit)
MAALTTRSAPERGRNTPSEGRHTSPTLQCGSSALVQHAKPPMRILVFGDPHPTAPGLCDLLGDTTAFEVIRPAPNTPTPTVILGSIDVAVVIDHDCEHRGSSDALVEIDCESVVTDLRNHRIGSILLTLRPRRFAANGTGVLCMEPTVEKERLRGAIEAMAHLRPVMRQIDVELTSMEYLGERLAEHFLGVDRELRLAARLQRDFLPRELPRVGPLRFATLFRPCNWVSGDIFDVFRLDEHHVGFYLADVVGHGVAAGLLTMFIKNAMQTKGITGSSYRILPPGEVLMRLNQALIEQDLPDAQFVTVWYGVVDTRTLELTYANGGHPPAVIVHPDRTLTELGGDGSLLGVFAEQPLGDRRMNLKPGARLLLFSDGMIGTLIDYRLDGATRAVLVPGIETAIDRPADAFIDHLANRLDAQTGGAGGDDASLVLIDVIV